MPGMDGERGRKTVAAGAIGAAGPGGPRERAMEFGDLTAHAGQPAFHDGGSDLAGHAGFDGCRPIDRKHLARYTLGDEALEEEILGLFLEQLPKTIATLRSAQTDKDWTCAAHTLKGSARCVGAWRLARSGEQAERLGGIHNRSLCLEAILRVEAAAEEARCYIIGLATPATAHRGA